MSALSGRPDLAERSERLGLLLPPDADGAGDDPSFWDEEVREAFSPGQKRGPDGRWIDIQGADLGRDASVWQPWEAAVAVDPAYRRRGIGSLLMRAAMQDGYDVLSSDHESFTPEGQSLSKALGREVRAGKPAGAAPTLGGVLRNARVEPGVPDGPPGVSRHVYYEGGDERLRRSDWTIYVYRDEGGVPAGALEVYAPYLKEDFNPDQKRGRDGRWGSGGGGAVTPGKYPRTPHLPWSAGGTDDDKRLRSTAHFEGKRVIVTEKLDGENTTMTRDGIHARSLDSRSHPSQSRVRALHGQVAHEIPEGYRIVGENMQARHSVGYEGVPPFLVFGVFDEKGNALAWDDVKEWAELLGFPVAPPLYDGIYDEKTLRAWPERRPSAYGDEYEGYVVRTADGFPTDDFLKHVAKWVRKDHVQTDKHWKQNWVENQLAEYDPGQRRGPDGRWAEGGGLVSDGLAASIKAVADLSRGNTKREKGDRPRSVYEYVLEHGRPWAPPLPESAERLRGEQGLCFANAANVVLGFGGREKEPGLRYVEGLALPEGLPVPIHHAWVVDENDRVLELTWPEAGTEYIGAEFDEDELLDALMRTETYGLLDWISIRDLPAPKPKVRGVKTPGFVHKDTPETFWDRMEMLGHERPPGLREEEDAEPLHDLLLLEGQTVAVIRWDPADHPRDTLGQFAKKLGSLPKPKMFGGAIGAVDVIDTPYTVIRSRRGFEVARDGDAGSPDVFGTAAEAADFVERRRREAKMKAEADELLRMERAEREAFYAERDAARAAREVVLVEERKGIDEARFPRDAQGRRYYHRLESPTQTAEDAAKQEASGELWGRETQNYMGGIKPMAQSYMGRLPAGARGLEFVTAHPVKVGAAPGHGDWSIGPDDERSGDLRYEGGFAKLKITVIQNTQVTPFPGV